MDQITQDVRSSQWLEIITQCQNRPEGTTAKQWMADNGISEKSYYYWLRKVKEELIQQSQSKFAEVNATFPNTPPDVSHDSAISICIGDATIHVNESSSGDLLRMVIEAVRHAE